MKHEERSWLKWQAKYAEEEKKDKRGEKFSSGLIDRASSVGGSKVFTYVWNLDDGIRLLNVLVGVGTALYCSASGRFGTRGMVFKRFYKNWRYCSTNMT